MFLCSILMNVAGCSRCQCFNCSPPTYAALHSLLCAEVNICRAALKYRNVFRVVMLCRKASKASPFLNQHKILCRSALAQILPLFSFLCSCLFCLFVQRLEQLIFSAYADSNMSLFLYSLVYLRAAMKDELKYILNSNRDTLRRSFKPFLSVTLQCCLLLTRSSWTTWSCDSGGDHRFYSHLVMDPWPGQPQPYQHLQFTGPQPIFIRLANRQNR